MSLMLSLPCLLPLPCVMFHTDQLYFCLPWAKPDLRKFQRMVLCGGLISSEQALLTRSGGLRACGALGVSVEGSSSAVECLVLFSTGRLSLFGHP